MEAVRIAKKVATSKTVQNCFSIWQLLLESEEESS
jgi:hypothetical protein